MQKRKRAGFIGVVDSGVGGLSVWREIDRLLPEAATLYFADQVHVPYGDRSLEEVRGFAEAIAGRLIAAGAAVIVIACNTMSAPALRHLRRIFPATPFVGMEPAIKPAVERTRSGVVAVLATMATFQGELFADLLQRFGTGVHVIARACPGLVEAVESGDLESDRTVRLVRDCLQPVLDAGADQLALGCTHFPFLRTVIERLAAGRLQIIDPAQAVARQVKRVADGLGPEALRRGRGGVRHRFLTTGRLAGFRRMARRLLPEPELGEVEFGRASWSKAAGKSNKIVIK